MIYDQIDIVTMIEVERGGRKVPMPHLMRDIGGRSLDALHGEIRAVQQRPSVAPGWGLASRFLALPFFLRRIVYRFVRRVPQWFREFSSPVTVTAVGMFGQGGGWGIPVATVTLCVTVGGIAVKPGVVDGRIEPRQFLDLTLSIDHDVVDGGPMARFAERFRDLLERADALDPVPVGEPG